MNYPSVQQIAKDTMAYISETLRPGMTLADVRARCEHKMLELGADSFWYYGVGAFVFAGDETARSVSGRTYKTPAHVVAQEDIVTIDLSPQRDGLWGDYARTLIVQDGAVVRELAQIRRDEWREGLAMEEKLHAELHRFATAETTFEQLYAHMNAFIAAHGFVNLDYHGNLGHSIELEKDDRIYIEQGNARRLGDVRYFTFEPHISVGGSLYGYKKENIYTFEHGELKAL